MVPMNANVRMALQKFAPHLAHCKQVRVLQSMTCARSEIVCVEEQIIVKMRGDVHSLVTESETMTFVAEHTSIPIPKMYGTHVDERGRMYMVIDFIPGETLCSAWPRLSKVEKEALAQDLNNHLDELRHISENYIGAVGKKPFVCDIAMTGTMEGPFNTEHDFNDFLVGLYKRERPLSHFISLLRKLLKEGHNVVFSHGDLTPSNILIQHGRLASIIDWEMAGFFPEYWEYARACLGMRWNDSDVASYMSFFQTWVKPYPAEAGLLALIDSCWMRLD